MEERLPDKTEATCGPGNRPTHLPLRLQKANRGMNRLKSATTLFFLLLPVVLYANDCTPLFPFLYFPFLLLGFIICGVLLLTSSRSDGNSLLRQTSIAVAIIIAIPASLIYLICKKGWGEDHVVIARVYIGGYSVFMLSLIAVIVTYVLKNLDWQGSSLTIPGIRGQQDSSANQDLPSDPHADQLNRLLAQLGKTKKAMADSAKANGLTSILCPIVCGIILSTAATIAATCVVSDRNMITGCDNCFPLAGLWVGSCIALVIGFRKLDDRRRRNKLARLRTESAAIVQKIGAEFPEFIDAYGGESELMKFALQAPPDN